MKPDGIPPFAAAEELTQITVGAAVLLFIFAVSGQVVAPPVFELLPGRLTLVSHGGLVAHLYSAATAVAVSGALAPVMVIASLLKIEELCAHQISWSRCQAVT